MPSNIGIIGGMRDMPRHFGLQRKATDDSPLDLTGLLNLGAILLLVAVYGGLAIGLMIYAARNAVGRELYPGQYAQLRPGETIEDMQAREAWFARQKMPDQPSFSCCGMGDAYYADGVEVDANGNVFAIITDERPDAPLGRPHIAIGTKILIPPAKNKDTRADPNPTGHTIVFVRWYVEDGADGNWGVFCYLPNGGV